MIYQAKKDSPSFEYIKNVLEKEQEEYEAYKNRVHEAAGFDFDTFNGYTANRNLMREYKYCSLCVSKEQSDTIDLKKWRVDSKHNGEFVVKPNMRTKVGKEMAKILNSYKSQSSHWDIHKKLNIEEPPIGRFTITQIFYVNGNAFVYFDDRVRADLQNADLEEITHTQFESLTKDSDED